MEVAIKRIRANDFGTANQALEEANQMSRLRHELLVELKRVFLSPLDLGRFQVGIIRILGSVSSETQSYMGMRSEL